MAKHFLLLDIHGLGALCGANAGSSWVPGSDRWRDVDCPACRSLKESKPRVAYKKNRPYYNHPGRPKAQKDSL